MLQLALQNGIGMAGKIRNLLERNGRYYARLVIPHELQKAYGKTEDRIPLGPDYRIAMKGHHGAMAILQERLAAVKNKVEAQTGKPATVGYYPLTPDQIALRHYHSRLAFDDELRNLDSRWANSGYIDDELVANLRDAMVGRASNEELAKLAGEWIERFRLRGNTDVEIGSDEWRILARALCISEYEALSRVAERDEGDFTGEPTHPLLAKVQDAPEPKKPISLKVLFTDYIGNRKIVGKGRESERRWRPVVDNLIKFLGHHDARRLTEQNLRDWRDNLLSAPTGRTHTPLSPKTVADVYLSSVRTILGWAVLEKRIESNVAIDVRQDINGQQHSREQGYTTPEAQAILEICYAYKPKVTDGRIAEFPETSAAKKWAPFLCAFSGARIGEVTQLRKSDIRQEGDFHVFRIRPDAGTVKTGHYRDVPIHPQIVDLGFVDFLSKAPDAPLFYRNTKSRDPVSGARATAGRISEWLRELELVPVGIDPNHGWRHRFKTVGREAEIADRVLDAIAGHASRTTGDNYGDVTLKTRRNAIYKLPYYDLSLIGNSS